MRILIAAPYRSVVGGVERYLQAIIPGLAIRGHQLALIHEDLFDGSAESIDSAQGDMPAWSIAQAGAEVALRRAADWRPDLVYSHGLQGIALRNALLNAYPNVLYAHNYFGTCATGQKCHAAPVPRPCSRQFGLGCLFLHYPRRCGGLHPGTMWKMFQESGEMNRQLPRYDALLVASEHMRREFQAHGVASNKVHLVPLPNPDEGQSGYVRGPTAPAGRILFIGRLTKLKGVGHLLPAISMAARQLDRPLSLTVAGDGPERAKLERLAEKFGVSARFVGWIDSPRKTALIEEMDLLAVPSLWPEPFGLVGIEAAVHGLPAVAYDVGGISDWLIPGETGELAPGDPPSPEGLADAIARALSDPAHYSRLSQGARFRARRFGLESHLTSLENIFETVVNEASPSGSPVRHGMQV